MTVKKIGVTIGGDIEQFTGLAADTTAWLTANTKNIADGSTYRELDGNKDLYEIQSGVWYKQ